MASLQSFAAAQQREGLLSRLPPRLRCVEVRQIVGSVSQPKVDTRTPAFVPRREGAQTRRYQAVLQAMRAQVPLPPIEVYALRGAYYVVDGHNRVAAARTLGYLYLDALVHEFALPATSAENRLHNERQHFERLSGLSDLVVTAPGRYPKLLRQIREHSYFLGQGGHVVDLPEAAQEWRADVYRPVTAWLARSGVPAHFPGRTLADLYGYVCDYKWMQSQNTGRDIGFPRALADFDRLYPPRSRVATVVTSALQAIRAPVRSALSAGRRVPAQE